MTQAAIVTNGAISYLYGAGNSKSTLVGTVSTDFLNTLWDVPDTVGLGYVWDGVNFNPPVTPVGPIDAATYAAIVAETVETANQLISQSVTAESNSRTQADASLQSQIDSLTKSTPVSQRTGTTDAIIESDRGSLLTYTNSGAKAVSIRQAGGSITNGWYVWVANKGAGTATYTPSVSTINGSSSLALANNETALIVSDGTNYFSATVSAGGVSSVNTRSGAVTLGAADRGSSYLNIDSIKTRGDADYTILATDRLVATSAAFTNPRTFTLPAASSVNAGQILVVADQAGGVTSTNTLTIARGGSDTINGGTTFVMRAAQQVAVLWPDGVSKWSAFTLNGDASNASNLTSGTVPAARGGAGTINGILKANGSGTVSQAVSATDYAPATSGSAILKGNGAGGFSNAASGTDYAPATSGTALLKGNGSGGFSSAASGTDYAPATSGSALLKGNGSGGFSSAVAKTDYWDTSNFTGDAGAGGAKGLVPAPATGDASKYLKGDGTWGTVASGSSRARAYGTYTTNVNLSTTIPYDDTIPQITEGTEVTTAAVTPASSSNRVRVTVSLMVGGDGTALQCTAAVFRNSTANAIYAISANVSTGLTQAFSFTFEDAPATTSATTYRLRVGPDSSTIRLNGTSVARRFGGAAATTLVVEEIAP